MPLLYGLIGYPLSHSFSPAYFKKKFTEKRIEADYRSFPLKDLKELKPLLKQNPDLVGLNVTIPYKEAILPLLHDIDIVALGIGAVNCIAIEGGVLKGYNTDAIGFKQSLLPLLLTHHTNALVLGTGGSSKAVKYILQKLGIPYQSVSRKEGKGYLAYSQINEEMMATHKLIINTTPLGMYPKADDCPPIPYHLIGRQHLLYDLIYNPEVTQFLKLGAENGAAIKNGFQMLQIQAEASWDIWQSQKDL